MMPLFRPQTDRIGWTVAETSSSCAGCPDAWFLTGFGEQDVQGVWVRDHDGHYVRVKMPEADVRQMFADEHVYVGGRDGYYVTLDQARTAIDADGARVVAYVDDFNEEFQDVFICDPASFPHNHPGAEAERAEPIR